MQQLGFPVATATAVSGLTLRQIRLLDERSLVKPSLGRRGGRGVHARYSFFDLIALRSIERLRACGESPVENMRRAMSELEKLRNGGWTSRLLATGDGQSWWLFQDQASMLDQLTDSELLIFIDLRAVDHAVRKSLEQFGVGAPADPGWGITAT